MMCFVNAANMANSHYKYIIQVSNTYNTNTVLLILIYINIVYKNMWNIFYV